MEFFGSSPAQASLQGGSGSNVEPAVEAAALAAKLVLGTRP
jgi:hypothetical protein